MLSSRRVGAAESVICSAMCPLETCEKAFWQQGKGPTLPAGLAFNAAKCAICEVCSTECSESPKLRARLRAALTATDARSC